MNLPLPGDGPDQYGGWTLPVDQNWFGHKARKTTFLYIVGVDPSDVPPMPLHLGDAEFVVGVHRPKKPYRRPMITKTEREKTPQPFAEFLVSIARAAI